MNRGLRCSLLVLALLGPTGSVAVAQSSSEVAAARQLFNRGLAAARSGDWEAAHRRFERSYGIAQRPNTLLNLAGAQAQTGRLVAATESYRTFIAQAEGRARRYLPQARSALEELEPRLASLLLSVVGLQEDDVVTLGERELAHAVLGLELPVDPGEYDLVVRRGDDERARAHLSLAEGARQELELDVTIDLSVAGEADPGASAPSAAFEGDRDAGDGGDDTGVIVGIVVGIAAAVAVGVTVGVVYAVDSSGPYQGTLGGGVLEFD